jgi:type IV secretion system protein VirD4
MPPGRALLLSEHTRPIRLRLHRCITGPVGKQLLADAATTAARVETARNLADNPADHAHEAIAWSSSHGLTRKAPR